MDSGGCRVAGVQRVGEDVVAVEAPLGDPDPLQELRKHGAEDARLLHEKEPDGRHRRLQRLEQLVANPFRGDAGKGLQRSGDRLPCLCLHRERQLGGEPAGPQRPQPVLPKTLGRVPDCPDDPVRQVTLPGVRIDHLVRLEVVRHRVDGEIAAGKVIQDRRGECDVVGSAAVAVGGLRAERGHFERGSLEQDGHRSVLDAGGNDLAEQGGHLLGQRIGGDIVVRVRPPHEDVAHRAAHQVALKAAGNEDRGEIADDAGNVDHAVEYRGRAGGMSRKAPRQKEALRPCGPERLPAASRMARE